MADARSQERLRILLDLTNRVVSKLELRELLLEISASVRQVVAMRRRGRSSSRIGKPEKCDLTLSMYPGLLEPVKGGRISACVQRVFRSGKCLNLTKEELLADPEFAASGTRSLSLLPLTSRGRVLGVFGIASRHEDAFTDDDLSFLAQIADQIALAVENAIAYREISELKDKLARENVYLESEIRSELGFEDIVGKSKASARFSAKLRQSLRPIRLS